MTQAATASRSYSDKGDDPHSAPRAAVPAGPRRRHVLNGAIVGIVGNQVVARYKLRVGKHIGSATLIADAKHSWLDALSSAGALVGLIAVALGQRWGDPVAGLAITAFICHVGYEVTSDVVHRLADGVDPEVIRTAEAAAGSVPGVVHAHVRARWTGRTLRIEIEGWVDPDMTARDADALGRYVADAISVQLPEVGSLTWMTRAAPSFAAQSDDTAVRTASG